MNWKPKERIDAGALHEPAALEGTASSVPLVGLNPCSAYGLGNDKAFPSNRTRCTSSR